MIRLCGHGFAKLFKYETGENFWTGSKFLDGFFLVHTIALFGGLLLLLAFSVLNVQNKIAVYSVLYPAIILGVGCIPIEPALKIFLHKNNN